MGSILSTRCFVDHSLGSKSNNLSLHYLFSGISADLSAFQKMLSATSGPDLLISKGTYLDKVYLSHVGFIQNPILIKYWDWNLCLFRTCLLLVHTIEAIPRAQGKYAGRILGLTCQGSPFSNTLSLIFQLS